MNIHADKSAGAEIENRTVFVRLPGENRESGGYANYSGDIGSIKF